MQTTCPTLLHITHWKAGSQWVKKILSELFPDRIVPGLPDNEEFLKRPVQAGMIYPALFISKWQHDAAKLSDNVVRFVVIRDLRDTLVSLYFSLKGPHPASSEAAKVSKAVLNTVSTESGFVYLLYEVLCYSAFVQKSWLEAGQKFYRYRDLLERDVEIFIDVLIRQCRMDVDEQRIRQVVEQNRFEAITNGRARGTENLTAHERKGVVGDWRNHFTERIKFLFKLQYGQLLIDTGYERDLNW